MVQHQEALLIGYRNVDFERKSFTADNNQKFYYYPHNQEACYDCIVSSNSVKKSVEEALEEATPYMKEMYYKALGRERYNSYKVNKFTDY